MVKIIDPAVDEFSLMDASIRQIIVDHSGTKEVIFAKFYAGPLVKVLKLLQQHYEVIVYTVIPRRFLDIIISMIPQFN